MMDERPYALERFYDNLRAFFDLHLKTPYGPILLFKKHIVQKRGVQFSTYLGSCVNTGSSSSQSSYTINEKGTVSSSPFSRSSLTEYRVTLLKGVIVNLLTCAGYEILEACTDATIKFNLTSRTCSGPGCIHCGPVTGTDGNTAYISLDEYHRLRENDMRAMSEHKYWEAGREETIKNLASAAVAIDLIQTKASNPVKLNISENLATGARENSSRGAVFILYNCARLAVLQNKFEAGVAEGIYPPLPKVEDIETSLLVQDEEWQLLFDFLLEYPDLLCRIVARAHKGEVQQHILCSFVFKLCHLFSVYYRRFRILQEPKAHLMPTVFARMVLVKAVDAVLKHALKILNIAMIQYM